MRKTVPLLLVLLAMVGCRTKLNEEKVITLDGLNGQGLKIDAIKSAQTVKVSATANSGTFNLYFFLAKDQTALENDNFGGKSAGKLLGSQLKATKADLSANVPANEEAVVMLMSADSKKAEVKLKVTN